MGRGQQGDTATNNILYGSTGPRSQPAEHFPQLLIDHSGSDFDAVFEYVNTLEKELFDHASTTYDLLDPLDDEIESQMDEMWKRFNGIKKKVSYQAAAIVSKKGLEGVKENTRNMRRVLASNGINAVPKSVEEQAPVAARGIASAGSEEAFTEQQRQEMVEELKALEKEHISTCALYGQALLDAELEPVATS